MAVLLPEGKQSFTTNGSLPLAGGKVYTYVPGTSTPKDTYTTESGSVANTNPVILDSRGEATIFWSGAYDVILKTSADVTIWGPIRHETPEISGSAAAVSADLASTSDAAKGDALLGVKRTATGAVATTQHVVNESARLNIVSHFGASKDNTNTTATTTALVAAIAAAAVIGNAVVEIPDGSYSITAGTNLASAGVAIEGMGRPTLNFVGAGVAASFDSGANGATVYGMRLQNVIIKGNASTTVGLYSRGMVHMLVRHVEVRECSTIAFRVMHGVDNHYDTCIYSTNSAAQTTKPSVGWALDNNGAGFYTANCTFTNCISEGFTGTGIQVNDARGNLFVGGAFEGVTGKGMDITSDTCSDNHFVNVWFEANTVNDAVIKGVGNTFTGCRFQSATSGNTVDVTTGTGTRFNGGYIRRVDLGASSSNTHFSGARFSDNVSLGITGTGSYTSVGCTRSNTSDVITAKYADRVGEPGGTWTPALASAGGGAQGAVTTAVGTHYRIGNVVQISLNLVVAKGTLGAGAVSITGLPFTSRNTTNAFQYITLDEYDTTTLGANYTSLALRIAPNGTTATLIKTGTGVASATVALADLPATVTLLASGSYQIEA